ncbi:MAG: tetratricopeptide repeat protein [Anaerolineales bacterium]|nr:tetratricopeptide repeat protein [Anaerolineales bacterium]
MLQPSKPLTGVHHLPPQPTPFIGRAEEVAEIVKLLADPACRLLTLIGPGGIGKTRLAIQVATETAAVFADGVYLVNLQPIHSADFLASAIADALDFSLRGHEEPAQELLNYLDKKEVLLVLDNFEQLLSTGGADPLADILEVCPAVKLLVTSREVLNLQEEWLYPVQGLSFPDSPLPPAQPGPFEEAATMGIEQYSAVQLFVERARRIRRDFALADELPPVVRICQLVEGVPLALELAASWVKTLPSEIIAAEIARNLDFLTTKLRNVPNRQRSMRAVFDYSWQLLSEAERSVFKRLAVFRGGFRREAAERVARASLPILQSLVDKSLLRSEPDGRYQMHELLRQYAAEQLVLSPADVAQMYDLHCAYYADFLHQRAEDVISSRQREAMREIAAELENIRAAWEWAVQQADITQLQKAAFAYYHFCDAQSRFREGANALEKGVNAVSQVEPSPQRDMTLALLLVELGWKYIRLGRLAETKDVLERSRAILAELGVPPPPGFANDPLIALGVLANIRGDYVEAARFGEEARRLSESRSDKQNLQIALYVLAEAAFAQGEYESALSYDQQAYTLTQETDNRWFMAYVLLSLGHVARALKDYAQARQHYQASHTLADEFDNLEGRAVTLGHLGWVAWLQQEYAEAMQLYQQSLALYREIGDRGGLATSLSGLAETACALGQYQTAQQNFREALEITSAMQFVPLTLAILVGVAQFLGQTDRTEWGVELLALALQHPASDSETKARAQQLLAHYEANLSPDDFMAAKRRGASSDFEIVTKQILIELAAPVSVEEASSSPASERSLPLGLHPHTSALVDPLTPRELEVLRLIAEGMTNQQIADRLIISVGTAKFYTSQIYGKLNVTSRTQAIARAREIGLLA